MHRTGFFSHLEKLNMVRVSSLMAAGVLLIGSACFAEVKSGIPVGESIKSFNPQNVTGPNAGKSACLV